MKLVLSLVFVAASFFCSTSAIAQHPDGSSSQNAGSAFRPAFDTILPKIRHCAQQIIEEHDKHCNASTLTGLAQHILEEHAIHVFVKYEPQPIGGILTVRADLIPAYQGIGSSTRALASKEITQAVEDLTSEQIEEISKMLVTQLGEDYSKGSIYKNNMEKTPNGAIVVNMDYRLSPHTHGME